MQEHYYNEIYYRTNEFKPGRLTLVFVHGVSGSSSAWWPYEKIFENKYNILNYDIRGHGMSKKFPQYSDYELKNFAEDLDELVTYLKIPKFILISNSFGAQVALEYLKNHSTNILGNIFTSPAVFIDTGNMAQITRPVLKILSSVVDIFPWNPRPRGHVDYSKHQNSTDWNIARNLADMRNTTPRVHFYVLRQSFRPNQAYQIEKINTPTLIIHGGRDTMVPSKNAILMSRKIKNSAFIDIPHIDHNTAHNAVREMSEAIEFFIEKNNVGLYKTSNLLQ